MVEESLVKTVFLFPSLIVPPIWPGLCSGISITYNRQKFVDIISQWQALCNLEEKLADFSPKKIFFAHHRVSCVFVEFS